jgi:hypothetical protein
MSTDDVFEAKESQAEECANKAIEAARTERGKREAYDALWYEIRNRPTNVAALSALARAIPNHHADGKRAVERLLAEYRDDAQAIDPQDFFASFHSKVLKAKARFCEALLEAAKERPDYLKVADLAEAALLAYEHLDTADVRQDLYSRRQADVRAEDERRRQAAKDEDAKKPAVEPYPARYKLAMAAGQCVVGNEEAVANMATTMELDARLVAAAAQRGLCQMSDASDKAARATINWLVSQGEPLSAVRFTISVAEAIERLTAIEAPPATPAVDPVTHAISLLPKLGRNRTKIAKAVGVKRTSMTGKKWKDFNQAFDRLK